MGFEDASSICEGCGWSFRNCHCGEQISKSEPPKVNRCACGQIIVSYATQCGPCFDKSLRNRGY